MKYDDIKIIVDGVVLPAPIELDLNLEDLDADSGRDVQSGVLWRNRIRNDVFKFSLTYEITDFDSLAVILKAIEPENVSVEIYDVKKGQRTVKRMYAGPKSMKFISYNGAWVKGLKFNLTEV